MNEKYVAIKLSSGENLVAEVKNRNDYTITLISPYIIELKVFSDSKGRVYDTVTAIPFFPYSEENEFTIETKHIMFIKQARQSVVQSYIKLVTEIKTKQLVEDWDDDYSVDDEEEIDAEQLEEYVEALMDSIQSKRKEMLEQELEEEPKDKMILKGNRTKH